MTVGPGKYDDEATAVREATGAAGVVLIVLGGGKGSGFSVQTKAKFLLRKLPSILRGLAAEIEHDVNEEN